MSVLILASISACKFWQSNDKPKTAKDLELAELSNSIPFASKEPTIFQTEILVSYFINGEKSQRKYFTARNYEKRLITFDFGETNAVSKLQTTDGKIFVINHEEKTFSENSVRKSVLESLEIDNFLTTKWLNEKANASFQNLGMENNLMKFLVKLESSEVVIFVDEKIIMPVKQEFYSVTDGQKSLTLSIELKNFKTEAEDKLFEVPMDFQKIE